MRPLLTILLILIGAVSGIAQQSVPAPSFEVASVKRTDPPFQERNGFIPTPGRFVAEKVPAAALIGAAYRDEISDMRGVPDWARSEYYDVTAPVPPDTSPAQTMLMLRSLLVERFKLAAHVEQEERDLMALVRIDPSRVPAGLQRIDVDCTPGAAPPPVQDSNGMPPCRARWNGQEYQSGGLPILSFVRMLRGVVGQQVLDETGLDGNFRFTFRHAPAFAGAPPPTDDYPDVTTALREQLGMRLIPRKSVVNILVVDRFEHATEN